MKSTLTDYQAKILKRLENGALLRKPHLGGYTPAFRFKGETTGVNSASLQRLRGLKLVAMTDELTMHGLIKYCHIPGQKPWESDPSWQNYHNRYGKKGRR